MKLKLKRLWKAIVSKYRKISTRKKIAIVAAFLFIVVVIFPLATYAYYVRDIADPERLMNRNSTGITLVDRHGKPFYSYGRSHKSELVQLKDISDHAEHALIASEDQNFYEHSGYSPKGMLVALYSNVANQELTKYGGSTLTQQLVKNNLLSSEKSFLRKYQELCLAIAIDRQYSKDEILEMYLNSVYFGEGAFGIEEAAKVYFNKAPADLTLAESSMLIGILPAPSVYSPISGDPELAKREQGRVLKRMVEVGRITTAERETILAEQLAYAEPDTSDDANTHAQHFAEMILGKLRDQYGEEKVARAGFQVKTGLDLEWQKAAEAEVSKRVGQLTRQGGSNAGLVAIDPKTGEIRTLVGSVDWNNPVFGKVNMATAQRQPGSSFKPVYFAEALDKKLITPATILDDSRRTFGDYTPVNYDFAYMGKMSARRALAQSRNLTAIEVMEKLGVSEAGKAAQRVGLDIKDPESHGLALALGTAETRLLDITNAYATYGNAGNQFDPVSILSIEDKFSSEVFTHTARPERVISAEASYLISSMLADPQARAPGFSSLTINGRPVAVKTGTTNDNRDAWTIGYTPSIAVGVWLGNNENQPMTGVAGGSGAGPIWKNSIQRMLEGTNAEQFTQPSGVEKVLICTGTNQRAVRAGNNTTHEYFMQGTAPTGTCNTAPVEEPKKPEEKKKEEKPKTDEEKVEDKPLEPTDPDTEEPEDPDQDGTGTGGTGGDGTGGGTGGGSGTGTGGGTGTTNPVLPQTQTRQNNGQSDRASGRQNDPNS